MNKETRFFPEDLLENIVDYTFMDKDVSELTEGKYYTFLWFNGILYMYKDGIVKGWSEIGVSYRAKYMIGTLRELSHKLELAMSGG